MLCLILLVPALVSGLNVDSLTASLYVETGMSYIQQGLTEKAHLEFTKALELSDTAWEAYLGLGRVSAIHGSWETAEENYLRYMELQPFDHRAAMELAEMLLELPARHNDAALYAGMALALAPTDGRCRLAAANTEAALGNTEEALIRYTLVITENEEYAMDARLQMGELLYSAGELAGAREVLLPAASSGEVEAHRLLTLLYLDQNDKLRASDSAARYLFLLPNGDWADTARTILEEITFESATGNPGE